MKRLFIFALVYVGLFTSCNEEDFGPNNEGIYSGTVSVTYFEDKQTSHSEKVTLVLLDGKFSSSQTVGGGYGYYSIKNNTIIFNNEVYLWNHSFDGNLVLSGKYNYTFNGKNLKISKRNDHAYYEYDLLMELIIKK